MADHSKPTTTSNYLDFVSELHGRMDDLAAGLDPERTSATNVPNYSIRWSSVAKKWQYLDGSSWKDLTNEYAINISGSAAKLKNARTISITGGGTAQPVPFDGSTNVQLTLESLDLDNLTGLGTAAKRDVGTEVGNVMEVGAFGLGRVNASGVSEIDEKAAGFYAAANGVQDNPLDYSSVIYAPYIQSGRYNVLFLGNNSNRIIHRRVRNGATEDMELHHTRNILKSTGNNDEFPMSQKAVTDATEGFGLGTETAPTATDLNATTKGGFYYFGSGTPNAPTSSYDYGLVVFGAKPSIPDSQHGDLVQLAISSGQQSLFIRGADSADSSGNPVWEPWTDITPIGVGQTWQYVTGSRNVNTTYTNSTGRAIMVSIVKQSTTNWGGAYVDGVFVSYLSALDASLAISFIVPHGSTYRVVGIDIGDWAELR